jgi:glycosyltransferase involved in cell wall biosynthesis
MGYTRATKLLWHSEWGVHTGFGGVSKNVLDRLAQIKDSSGRPKYEITVMSLSMAPSPFEGPPQAAYRVVPQYGNRAAAPYGHDYAADMVNRFRPDIVVTFGDTWMLDFWNEPGVVSPDLRKTFKLVGYVAIDGYPIPDFWVEKYQKFDKLIAFAKFGKETIDERARLLDKKLDVSIITHGVDTNVFKPLPRNVVEDFKRANGMEGKKIIGMFSRNQPRKHHPEFVEFAARLLEKTNNDPSYMFYMHCIEQDAGWDLPALIRDYNELGIRDRILKYGELAPGQEIPKPKYDLRNRISFPGIKNPAQGYPEDKLNMMYNMCDAHVLLTSGEGWGLCLGPDTLLHTKNRATKIKDVEIGDSVLSLDGKYHKILGKTSRKVNSVYELKIEGCLNTVVTKEHPFLSTGGNIKQYVSGKKDLKWINVGDLKKGDLLCVPKPKYLNKLPETLTISDFVSNVEKSGNFIFKNHGYSPKNNEFSYTQICKKYNTTKKIAENAIKVLSGKNDINSSVVNDLALKLKKDGFYLPKQNMVNNVIRIDDRLLELFGWYLAEGSTNKGRAIEIDLNIDEIDVANRLAKYIKEIFGLDSVVHTRGNKSGVRCCSSILAEFFSTILGKGAHNKCIPGWLEDGGNLLGPLVYGLVHGDGHFSEKRRHISFTSVSQDLVIKLRNILLSNNIFSCIKKCEKRACFDLRISVGNIDRFLEFIGDKKWNITSRYINPIECDDYYLVSTDKIVKKNSKLTVYDICVDGTHNFVANGVLVHNTVIESISAGVPTFTNDYAVAAEQVRNSGCGLTLKSRDYTYRGSDHNFIRPHTDYDDVVDKVLSVLADEEKKKKMSKRGRAYAQSMSWDLIVDDWDKAFDSVMYPNPDVSPAVEVF